MTETSAAPVPEMPPVAIATCPNCGAEQRGPFCYTCGQPEKGLIRHFSGIIGDFLDTVFSIDSRTLRTLGPLYFKPGFLSNEYFAGRRVRYVTPLRLYFFLSLIAFLVISLVANPTPNDPTRARAERFDNKPPTPEEREKTLAELDQGEDKLPRITFSGSKPWHPADNPLTFSWLSDGMNAALNAEIGEVLEKSRRINKDPAPFFRQVFSLAPQTLFLILPIFALLLKLVYLFKRRFYTEHLIVALHSHSFLCLSLILIVLLAKTRTWAAAVPVVPGIAQFLLVMVSIWIGLYLLLMQKRVYRQGWPMTVLKYGFVGFCYIFLLSFGMVATMVASIILL